MTGRPPRGRPTRLTERVRLRFLQALDLGYNRSDAICYVGIGPATFYRWMRDDRPEFREFREAVERAENAREDGRGDASLQVRAVGNLLRLSRRSTRAALAWLAVNAPAEWGPDAFPVLRRPRSRAPRRRRS